MSNTNLELFFNPKSIAIIGASQNIATINGRPLYYLTKHGYEGKIYPINPKYKEINGYTCYPSINDVPGPVDLALIVVNYKMVHRMLEQCAEKGVKFASVFSSGFAEAGEEGKRMQEEIAALSQKTGLRLCGPNCQGGVSLHHNTAAAFSAALNIKPFLPGPVGFITQSGALGYSIFNIAQEDGVGFSYVISTGNEVDLNSADFIDFMLDDENTNMVFTYMEGIRNGDKLAALADKAIVKGKPLAFLKVGRSEVGSRAASSHTAALTGSDAVFDAFARQKGIIRVDDIEEFVDLAKLMDGITKIPQGKGLGVISTSGGGGVICADAAEDFGLEIVDLHQKTIDRINQIVPHFGSALNPVDMTAQAINEADGFWNILQAVKDDPGVDAIVVVITNITGEPGMRMARDVVRMREQSDIPIVVAWTSGPQLMQEQFDVLEKAKAPYYRSPVRAIKSLSKLMKYGTVFYKKRAEIALAAESKEVAGNVISPEVSELIKNADKALSEHQAKKLLSSFGITTTKETVAANKEEALAAAESIGYPLAMKVDSPDIMHKTEAKAIKLNIQNKEEMLDAYQTIMENARSYDPKAKINGVLIQEMVVGGVEVIVGMNRDPQFGPTLMFGLGGIFVEILKDVSFRVAPTDHAEALAMIKEIKGYGVLAGARGRAKADVDALADVLVKVSQMALTMGPQVAELDINPLIVLPEGKGVRVADALVVLGK